MYAGDKKVWIADGNCDGHWNCYWFRNLFKADDILVLTGGNVAIGCLVFDHWCRRNYLWGYQHCGMGKVNR